MPCGTSRSMSSVVRTVTGMAMMASAAAPAMAEKCPIGTTTIWYTNRPTMIEGALSSTSFTKRMSADSRELPPYSAR